MLYFTKTRLALTLILIFGAVLAGPLPTAAQGPANDLFANSMRIDSFPYVDTGSGGGTIETGEPVPSCVQSPLTLVDSVWYAVIPPGTGVVRVQWDEVDSSLAAYTGTTLENLVQAGCANGYSSVLEFNVEPGATYYVQVGYADAPDSLSALLQSMWAFKIRFFPQPPNDNFAQATPITNLPFGDWQNFVAATTEPGEPLYSSGDGDAWTESTFWYAFTPSETAYYMAYTYSEISLDRFTLYTGTALENLSFVGSSTLVDNWYDLRHLGTFLLDAGTMYYYQVAYLHSDSDLFSIKDEVSFTLKQVPAPEASFTYLPADPSIFDTIAFQDTSTDPLEDYWINQWGFIRSWDFGDGGTGYDNYTPTHQYSADGDYLVTLQVETLDHRTSVVQQLVQVRTHDVSILWVATSTVARVGKTAKIKVLLQSLRYPERVQVDLYRLTSFGETWLESLEREVPARLRPTRFLFTYTFTPEDAGYGKIRFKAVATILDGRDALPEDNQAVSLPVRVLPKIKPKR